MQICFIVSATKIISIKAFAHSFSVFSVMCHFTSLTINTCNLKTYHFWSVFVCATPSICQSVNLLPCRHSHWGLGRVRSESNLAAKTRRQFSLLVLATFSCGKYFSSGAHETICYKGTGEAWVWQFSWYNMKEGREKWVHVLKVCWQGRLQNKQVDRG